MYFFLLNSYPLPLPHEWGMGKRSYITTSKLLRR
jgi:hypothetical protein